MSIIEPLDLKEYELGSFREAPYNVTYKKNLRSYVVFREVQYNVAFQILFCIKSNMLFQCGE